MAVFFFSVLFFFFENEEKILGYLIRFASVITPIQIVVFFHSRTQVGVFVCMIVGIVYENDNHCYIAGPFFPKSARSHWLLQGHMTSNNATVSPKNL